VPPERETRFAENRRLVIQCSQLGTRDAQLVRVPGLQFGIHSPAMCLETHLRFPRNPRRVRLHRKKVTQNFVFHFSPPVLFRQLKTRFRLHTDSQPFVPRKFALASNFSGKPHFVFYLRRPLRIPLSYIVSL